MQLNYYSKTPGIGGTIKNSPEDFLVEEIMENGTVLETDKKIEREDKGTRFLHFVLQKCDWATANAIKTIAKRLRISFRRFNFAGNKDKVAITTQLVSCFAGKKEFFEQLNIKDMKILGCWYADEKIDLGDLLGNRFTIKVQDCENGAEEKVKKIAEELENKFPNYFGEQRFGTTRKNTHLVGEKILRGNFEEAALMFLCDSEGEEHEEARLARQELKNTGDYKTALRTFPGHLKLERSMIAHLAEHSNDYINGFRRLPRNILLLFLHAFQSHLFNITLSERIAKDEIKIEDGEYFCGEDSYGFPDLEKKQEKGWLVSKLIGYETNTNERENALLEKAGIKKEDFKIRSIPEISSKGTYRTFFTPLKDFEVLEASKDVASGHTDFSFANNIFKFSLPSGSYATVAMREFLDKK